MARMLFIALVLLTTGCRYQTVSVRAEAGAVVPVHCTPVPVRVAFSVDLRRDRPAETVPVLAAARLGRPVAADWHSFD